MRKLTFVALAVAATAIVAACSSSGSSSPGSSGSGLTGRTWQLTAINKAPTFPGPVPAADQANYTIEFKSDGTFSAKADCNTVSGTYTTTSTGGLTVVLGSSTMAACPEGSLAPQYVTGLGNAASYAIANSQLTITLKDGGTLVYK